MLHTKEIMRIRKALNEASRLELKTNDAGEELLVCYMSEFRLNAWHWVECLLDDVAMLRAAIMRHRQWFEDEGCATGPEDNKLYEVLTKAYWIWIDLDGDGNKWELAVDRGDDFYFSRLDFEEYAEHIEGKRKVPVEPPKGGPLDD